MKPWQKFFRKNKPLTQQEIETWVRLSVEPEELLRTFQKFTEGLERLRRPHETE